MSVMLLDKSKINSLARTYANNENEERAIWYAYVSNVCAYNLQYLEYEAISFESEKYSNIDKHTLGSLHYNIATNEGNTFMQHKWYKIFKEMLDRTNKMTDLQQEELAKLHNVAVKESLI
jgi:hypothetical protein